MKLSELRAQLRQLQYKLGDVSVEVRNPAGEFDCIEDIRLVIIPLGRVKGKITRIHIDTYIAD